VPRKGVKSSHLKGKTTLSESPKEREMVMDKTHSPSLFFFFGNLDMEPSKFSRQGKNNTCKQN
jgi:hypothetical protein